MISLTGLKGQKQELQLSLLTEIKNVPDTVLILKNGNCLRVKETAEEVMAKIIANPLNLANRLVGVLS